MTGQRGAQLDVLDEILSSLRLTGGVVIDAEFSGGKYVDREVVVSGNLVTARTWHDNPAWMREYVKLLRAGR